VSNQTPKTVDLKTVLIRRGRTVEHHVQYHLESGEHKTLASLLLALESNGAYSLCDEVKAVAKEVIRSKQKPAPVVVKEESVVDDDDVVAEKQDEPNKKPPQKRKSSNVSEPLTTEPALAVSDDK
jgi:hypothetical protein